jgi:hypothetical protein
LGPAITNENFIHKETNRNSKNAGHQSPQYLLPFHLLSKNIKSKSVENYTFAQFCMDAKLASHFMGRQSLKLFQNKVLRISKPTTKEMIGGNFAMRSFVTCIPHQIILEWSSEWS